MPHLSHSTLSSPLGYVTVFANDAALTAIRIDRTPPAAGNGHNEVTTAAVCQLQEYLAGTRQQFDLPLAPAGTSFQLRVWAELRGIPFGETITYGELARRIGQPTASRAVGQVNAKNPLPIVVPCHRVVGAQGRLIGYALGLDRKRWLLQHERVTQLPTGGQGLTMPR